MPDTPGGGGNDGLPDADRPGFQDDDGTWRCGVPKKTDGGPCRHPVPSGVCPAHGDVDSRRDAIQSGDANVVPGVGSGDPDHQMGDGQPPDGNKNRLEHGVFSVQNDPFGLLDYLGDEEPRVYGQILAWFWDEAGAAPFAIYQSGDAPLDDVDLDEGRLPEVMVPRLTSKAADLLLIMVNRGVIWRATLEQTQKGLAEVQKRKDSDGGYVDVVDELRVNLPKNRMRREDRQALKDLGLRDESPDAQAAQGQRDLAAASERIAKRREQMADEDAQDGESDA